MKKIFMGIATVTVAACMLAGCGESEEERFDKAKESMDNYTATVICNIQDGDKYEYKFEIDGSAVKITSSYELTVSTCYYKEEGGKLLCYEGPNSGWRTTSGSKMSDLLSDPEGGCCLAYFEQFFYDDFEKDGDYLKMTSTALEGYSAKLGDTLSSAKLTLDESHFDTAIFVIQAEGGSFRLQYEYKFTDYGSTSITLPE